MQQIVKYHLLNLILLCTMVCSAQTYTETGTASYYHDKFVGRKTATGEIYSQDKLTAAHKTLPLNSWVKVTNLKNDSVIIVRINDRMPQWNKRTIDLTKTGAKKLNYLYAGLTRVRIEVIPDPGKIKPPPDKKLTTMPVAMIPCDRLTIYRSEPTPVYPHIQYIRIRESEPFYTRWFHALSF